VSVIARAEVQDLDGEALNLDVPALRAAPLVLGRLGSRHERRHSHL
jgi:hypothetical protein